MQAESLKSSSAFSTGLQKNNRNYEMCVENKSHHKTSRILPPSLPTICMRWRRSWAPGLSLPSTAPSGAFRRPGGRAPGFRPASSHSALSFRLTRLTQRADPHQSFGSSLDLPEKKKCEVENVKSSAGWVGKGEGKLIPSFQAALPAALISTEKRREAHSCHFKWVLACIILSIRQCYPLCRIFRLHFKSIRDSQAWSRRAQ